MQEATAWVGSLRGTGAAVVLVAALAFGCSPGRGDIGDAVDHGGSLVSKEGQIAFTHATKCRRGLIMKFRIRSCSGSIGS